ncbi:sugar ABC transporter ATP-binding protein [Phytohabitans aurantiacus]|jgi:monosaccharide-transporting ATPase|uniref:Sugar ABC transporter ATP-binding protein n=1 Tax=Phytohabitans aurantiacus TaxID=3016789 RepID=A0ABQ5QSC3_9ACTN|nr:sugar ABC transporter ATP-binding protein [Phytohabitans aurantiacus]GLH96486.1 sugar ABC transporter ATP-binding protein [Phytohabitans aurantiacus]
MTTAAVRVRAVSKRFAGVRALDGVSLDLYPGEAHALVGENGAGKSTLIKLITGVHHPDEGQVCYLDEPVLFAGPREAQAAGISTIYQEVNLVPMRSVAGNLFLGREPTNRLGLISFRRMNRQAREVLRRYGITADVRRPLGELGLGVQQMIAVARALSTDARVVIMDEPTSSLEPREVDRLVEVIELLRRQRIAVLYVTHKLDEVFRVCQRVTVLRDGRVVHSGPVAETTRLRLVATMLGRDVADVREHGATSFSEQHQAAAGELVLRAEALTRRPLLDGVSVDVHAGEVVGLAGLLGSGRTETAKAVFGADPVDSGSVRVGAEARASAGAKPARRRWSPAAAIRRGIGMVPEDRGSEGVIGELSVRDNIVLAALPRLTRAGFLSDRRQDALVDTFVKRLRIKASSPDQKVRELSGGNQQKVLLARMLCLYPKVLILDEPTRGIDVGAKAEIQALIDELAAQGLGVLLISSELEEVVEGSDRVLVLRDGAVVGTLRGTEISEDRIMQAIAAGGEERP